MNSERLLGIKNNAQLKTNRLNAAAKLRARLADQVTQARSVVRFMEIAGMIEPAILEMEALGLTRISIADIGRPRTENANERIEDSPIPEVMKHCELLGLNPELRQQWGDAQTVSWYKLEIGT